jgi:hypothetical protein
MTCRKPGRPAARNRRIWPFTGRIGKPVKAAVPQPAAITVVPAA